jgi:virginiamycin B lyase
MRGRRVLLLVGCVIAAGCSTHASMPQPPGLVAPFSPQVVQEQPLQSGNWTWTSIPHPRGQKPNPVDVVSDGRRTMWVAALLNEIVSVAMNQKVTVYPISFTPSAITVGPDQNIWVAGNAPGHIASVTPTGTEVDHPIGSTQSTNGPIIVGPDNALWFAVTDTSSSGLGRMTTAGAYTYFSLFTSPGEGAADIASGPDGNLWVAVFPGSIHKVSTQGVDTAYTVDGNPVHIVAGADGALWFTEYDSDSLGRITTDGGISEFTTPTTNFLFSLMSGPGGKLWLTDEDDQRNEGVISFDPITSVFGQSVAYPNGGVTGIAEGPDRNIWVTADQEQVGTYVWLAMTLTPSHLVLSGPGKSASVTVTETHYRGTWTGATSSRSIATVTESSPGVFMVTAVGAGKCTITISDTTHNFAHVGVVVQ